MILCIDSGNTRLKWGLYAEERWVEQGVLLQAEVARLHELVERHRSPLRIMVANVAGPLIAEAIDVALRGWQTAPEFVCSKAVAGGVCNSYDNPAQLGVDRWCALIGARSLTQATTVVIGSGTATTIDTLDAEGRFLGGIILPGFELMRASLARNTAQLPLATGEWRDYPRCTDDAIASGCVEAQLGAAERAFARIASQPNAACLLFGGGAPVLAGRLNCPHRLVENLVLDGLLVLASEPAAPD